MKQLKKIALALALVSVSVPTLAQQWTSIDNLVTASDNIVTDLNAGLRRVSGVIEYSPVGGISQDGYLTTVHMDQAKADAYNNAVMEVQNDTFMGKTAEEYLGEQSVLANEAFGQAVDAYVQASYIFIEAVVVNNMAADAQATGDYTQAQAVQSYVVDNNVLITSQNVTDYNEALDTVELSAETWATVEAVYMDGQAVAGLQQQANDAGVDFIDAQDLFLDRFQMGQPTAVVEFLNYGEGSGLWLTWDVSNSLKTIEEMNQAGAQGSFYQDGPTQNECFFDPYSNPQCPIP